MKTDVNRQKLEWTVVLYRICNYGVIFLTGSVLFYLTLLSLFSTSYISDKEAMFYVSDRPLVKLLFLALVVFAFILAKKFSLVSWLYVNEKRLMLCLCLIFALLSTFVLSTMQAPIYDQNKIFQAAKQIMHLDFSSYLPGGYVERYSNQQGIVLLFALIFSIFGEGNHVAIQLCNVVALIGTYYFIYRICRILWKDSQSGLAALSFLFFVPLWGYVTFVYGTLYSMVFATAAVYYLMMYSKNSKWIYLHLSADLIAISILIKMNSIIFLIAMILILAVSSLEQKKVKHLLGVLLLIGVTVLASCGLKTYVNHMTNGLYSDGIPRAGHIAMGLQESGTRAPGWYNGYIENTYEETGFDYNETEKRAKDSIQESIRNFAAHPTYAIGFLVRKTASQWNEPTFEGIFIQQNRSSEIKSPGIVRASTENTKWNHALVELFNILQSIIYFGAFLYMIENRKRKDFLHLSFAVIFLGGFLFHTLWEASSQYTVVYFVLLIPYAVVGFWKLAERVYIDKNVNDSVGNDRKIIVGGLAAFCALILVLALSGLNTVTSVILLNRDNQAYKEYSQIAPSGKILPNGRYKICDPSNENRVLSIINASMLDEEPAVLEDVADNEHSKRDGNLTLFYEKNAYTIRFECSGKALDVKAAGTEPGTIVQQYESNGDVSQQWKLRRNEDGSYTIFYTDTLVLSADSITGDVTVEKESNDYIQKWEIRR